MSAKVARRYATAFLEAALEQNELEKANDDIMLMINTLRASNDLRLFLKSPIIKKDQKSEVLATIFENKINALTVNLLNILSDKGRLNLLDDIGQNFIDIYNIHNGIIEVNVITAEELGNGQLDKLVKELELVTGKKVKANISVDKDLIGGILVRIGDTVIDGTVKYKLNQLKDRFASAALE
jgi:F-type H+-transporting ATPase subunit delta